MKKNDTRRRERLLGSFFYHIALTTFSINAFAAPADGLIFWNEADKDPNIILSNGGLDIEISSDATTPVGVRINRPMYPGEGPYYLEMTNLYASGNTYSFGLATADAVLQGLDVEDTVVITPFSTNYPAVGVVVDYRSEYPIIHFFGDDGSGLVHLESQKMRDHHGPVYLYLSAYRNGTAVEGQPQHRLSFGTVEPFTYDADTTVQLGIYQGHLDLEYGWPIDDEHPTISITSGNQVTLEGGSLTFMGAASDAESGDLSAAINWYLDDVLVATGSSAIMTPSTGTHSVRAEVQDSLGQISRATARADVIVNSGLDHDRDGLLFFEEIDLGTDPGVRDTDADDYHDDVKQLQSALSRALRKTN